MLTVKAIPTRIISLVLFSVLYFLRRPADALYPSVWTEDAILNIPQAIADGWASLLTPVAGYLLIPSKLITLLSLSLSGIFYPEIAYFLTFIFTLGVLVILTSEYVSIKGKEYLPLIVILLPYDPEVFATPLYIFWWVSLLLLVPLFSAAAYSYRFPIKLYLVKLFSVFFACLSSPLCILLFPLIIFRSFITKARIDYFAIGLWFLLAMVQFSFIRSTDFSPGGYSFSVDTFKLAIPRYFGNYFHYNGFLTGNGFAVSLTFAAFVGLGCWALGMTCIRKKLEFFYIAAAFLMSLLAILSSIVRVGLLADPFTGGPRYFFFPYVFLSVFLLSLLNYFDRFPIKIFITILLILACLSTWINDFSLFYRIHDPISWRSQLQSCANSQEAYRIKVQTNGEYELAWEIPYSPEDCQQIINRGVLTQIYEWRTLPQ